MEMRVPTILLDERRLEFANLATVSGSVQLYSLVARTDIRRAAVVIDSQNVDELAVGDGDSRGIGLGNN